MEKTILSRDSFWYKQIKKNGNYFDEEMDELIPDTCAYRKQISKLILQSFLKTYFIILLSVIALYLSLLVLSTLVPTIIIVLTVLYQRKYFYNYDEFKYGSFLFVTYLILIAFPMMITTIIALEDVQLFTTNTYQNILYAILQANYINVSLITYYLIVAVLINGWITLYDRLKNTKPRETENTNKNTNKTIFKAIKDKVCTPIEFKN